jgi:DNA-binding NtrC family response regulator
MPAQFNLLLAHAEESPWVDHFAQSLVRMPFSLHHSRNEIDSLNVISGGTIHLSVVDDNLPGIGGLALVRRLRRMGHEFPCLLVCDAPGPRLLREALDLDVFSVVQSTPQIDLLPPMLVRAVRQFYEMDLSGDGGAN